MCSTGRTWWIMVVVVIALAAGSVSAHGDPMHRYGFDGDVNDSAGAAHGVLVNNTGNAAYAGGQLALGNDGSQRSNENNGDYVDLPNGLISGNGNQATFEAWTTWGGGGAWQRIFDFGTSDGGEDASPGAANSTYVFTTPSNGGVMRTGYRDGPTATERWIDTGTMASGAEQHVAVVWDGANTSAALYVNGTRAAYDPATHIDLSAMLDNNNWLGRAQ